MIGISKTEYNRIYCQGSGDIPDYFWIASPCVDPYAMPASDWGKSLKCITYNGILGNFGYLSGNSVSGSGFRPIICLKSSVLLEKNEATGNYRIIQ